VFDCVFIIYFSDLNLLTLLQGRGKKTTSAAAKKQQDGFNWVEALPDILSLMSKALRLRVERIWTTTQERDTFVGCVGRCEDTYQRRPFT
jgi:hypothetical protein